MPIMLSLKDIVVLLLLMISVYALEVRKFIRKRAVEGNADKHYTGKQYRSLLHCGIEASSRGVMMYGVSRVSGGFHCIYDDFVLPDGKWAIFHDPSKALYLDYPLT